MNARLAMVASCCVSCGRVGFDELTADTRLGPGGDGDTTKISLVQSGPVQAVSAGDLVLTLTAPSTSGTLLVATLSMGDLNLSAVPPSWTIAVDTGTFVICYIAIAYYPNNPGGIMSVTFSLGAGAASAGQLSEWSGVALTSPHDQSGFNTTASASTAVVATNGAITSTDELAITSFCQYAANPSFSPEMGWTNLGAYGAPTSFTSSLTTDFQLGPAVGSVRETQTTSVPAQWAGVIATFRP